ncbi:MAG: class I SAM-dependent DNA methyltransferase [Synergistaceae bacterium]|nr:class I SAM-dependent DNA methyltransferase [Synergistaceae bacterium]
MKNFIERWKNIGDEKSDTQKFWLEFLRDVLNVEKPEEIIEFEKRVELAHKSFIDGYITSTRTIIEQKSWDVKLDNATKQSDGSTLTPFEQAKRYSDWLPDSEHARWIVTCNFQEFHIHDMERPKAEPEIIRLENLEDEAEKFAFLIDLKAKPPREIREEKISIEAGKLVEKLKSCLETCYQNPNNDEDLQKENERSLTILCVRIVFLLYAEDSGLFEKSQFHNYLEPRKIMARDALIKLFNVLDTKIEERDLYIDEDLKKFPFVNGGLFKDKNVLLPHIDDKILKIILHDMSECFNWRDINPTIFGSIFERVLNDSERESGGMHYTTIENIHKVIDPLFLDDLKANLDKILKLKSNQRTKKLIEFQENLGNLNFLDPACGSGNFLTETYLSLRRLENEILSELMKQQINFASGNLTPIKVKISQFFGIEINDFAVAVAKTALWIAEAQMWNETKEIVQVIDDVLPLEKFEGNIVEANALKLDWSTVIKPEKLNFIMGNPPFVGYSNQSKEQKEEILAIYVDEAGKPYKTAGKIDYVAGWYFKAARFIRGSKIHAAFVATNSITQGEQVAAIFKPIYERWGIEIDFAHQSFVWNSELKDLMANVHCVIIGFSTDKTPRLKKLFTPEGLKLVDNINFYLSSSPKFFIEARKTPICSDAPMMTLGNLPRDGGNLILTPEDKDKLLKKIPAIKRFIRQYIGADEFINGDKRYCLWLVEETPEEFHKMPAVMARIKAVKKFRLASKREATQKLANTSWLFAEIRQPDTNYIAVPLTTGESRNYIPIGFMSHDVIISNAISIIPDATLYHFGVLTSRVHMAWMKATAGRLGISYRYSSTIVYNNFVWPSVSAKQRLKIESAAQKILDARAKYPESSFADLYNDDLMPPELRKAHKANDAAVCEAYGFDKNISEEEIVSELMKLYEKNVIK